MAIFCLKLEQIATLGASPRKPEHLGRKVARFFSNAGNRKFALFFRFDPRTGFADTKLREFIKSCYHSGTMSDSLKYNLILTSSFNTVVAELQEKSLLPKTASVAFIPTAGDPYPKRPWIDADRKALVELGYSVTDIELKSGSPDSLEKVLSNYDIIFVAGGNTTYLVEQVHLSGFASVVRKLLGNGKMYIGSSAGSILAGPTVEPFAKEDIAELPKDFVLTNPSCLRLVDYVVLPHDQVEQFSAEHDKIISGYSDRLSFVRLTDHEYRLDNV